ncbi:MAG: CHAT domain-containing tetratricopeptide repeat protein [Pyrinomonadaceae bacterium]
MRLFTGCLASALVASLTFAGGGGAVSHGSRASAPAPAGGAKEDRDEGRKLLHRGRAAEALVHLENALKAFRQSGDVAGQASTQDLIGELYERQGRYDLAERRYSEAHELYAASAKPAKGGKALALPGGAPPLPGGGKTRDAGEAVSTVAKLSAEERDYNARLMLAKVGRVLDRLGDAARARGYYEQLAVSVKPPKKSGPWSQLGKVAAGTAANVASGDMTVEVGVPSGLGLLTAKTEFDRYRQAVLYASLELGLGRMDFKENKLDSAQKHFDNALGAAEADLPLVGRLGQSRRLRAAARTSLGDVAFEKKNYREAAKLYKKAEEGARDDKRPDLMWPAQRGTGRSLWAQAAAEKDLKKAQQMRADALVAYRQAVDTVETIRRGSVRADESRTSFIATTAAVFEEAAAAFAETALLTQTGAANSAGAMVEGPALASASEALAAVERGRARALLDLLNESGAEIAGDDVPADLLEKRRANQARQSEIAALLTGVNLGESEKEKKPKELEEELDGLQSQLDTIENDIRTRSPRYNSLTGGVPLKLEEIRARVLDDETALLEYSLGEERSYLLAVTGAGFHVSRLPGRAEVGRLVADFRQQLVPSSVRRSITDLVAAATDPERGLKFARARPETSPAVVKAYADAARALYAATVEPAAPLFKTSRLLVVADGALNYVPFHALVTKPASGGADFTSLEYLLKTNDTVFAPSASVLAAVREQRASAPSGATAAGGMLVVADPVFDASDSRARAAGVAAGVELAPGVDSAVADVSDGLKVADFQPAAGERRLALVRLAGTAAEAEQIRTLASGAGRGAEVLTGMRASEAELASRDLRQYRVLHFATHGLLNAERPQFTGVVLSLVGNRAGTDGFLRADEVYNLRLGSPLVMLSACESGLGREKRGEGVMGLTRAFMYAGAPTVGVTLWSVSDRATVDLMASFYRSLLGARPAAPSAALNAARRTMLARKETSAPYFWAPFVMVGDWR